MLKLLVFAKNFILERIPRKYFFNRFAQLAPVAPPHGEEP